MSADQSPQPWLEALDPEDLTFLKRFLLASGSLKELARIYEVSYPTVRLRLDRLIQRVEIADQFTEEGAFERHLRLLLADGVIDAATFKKLWSAHLQELDSPEKESPATKAPAP